MKSENIHEDQPCDCCGNPVDLRFSRRTLLRTAGIAGLGAMVAIDPLTVPAPARAQQPASPNPLPARGEFVIRKGSLVTVDPVLGNISGGDIHVRDGQIMAIGPDLAVPAGTMEIDASRMIVIPGLIDTHFHIWTSIMRNMLAKNFEYFAVKGAFVPYMTPSDFYASDMLAMAESLNAGITTLHNFCHHVVSPETVEAEMRAHQHSGMRAFYSFGHKDGLANDKLIDLALAEDVRKQWFGSSSPFGGLVTFGTNSRGPGALPDAVFRKEMDWAFERDLLVAMHAGQNRYSYSVVPMKEMGYLGPKTLIVHFVLAKPEDRAAMLATGASLSYSVHSELRLGGGGYQAQQLVHMANSGVNVSFSFDTNSLAPIDMFETMSTAWYMGVPFTGTDTEKLQPLDFAQVIKMATINGAKALGLEAITGSLTVGKRADIVLIRADDLNMVPYGFVEGMVARTARAANVDTVIADGRIMKRGGKLVGLDVETIKGEAVRSAYDLRKRAGGKIAVASDVIPKF